MYKMLIVDDEPIIRMGLSSILDYTKLNIEVVGTASTGSEALELIYLHHPELIMMDINIPGPNGLEVIECVKEENTYSPFFIILTCHDEFGYAQKALQLGALDYLLKIELTPEILKTCLEKAISRISQTHSSLTDAQPYEHHSLAGNFFLKLLNNWFDSPDFIHSTMDQFSINLSGSSFSCALFSNLPARSEAPTVSPVYICNLIVGLCKNRGQICYAVPWDSNSFALIFSFNYEYTVHPEFHQETFFPCVRYVQDMLYRYQNILYWIGIGAPVSSIEQIYLSFNEAKVALRNCCSQETISLFSKNDSRMGHSFNISILRQELINALDNYDTTALVQLLSQIPELIQGYVTDPEQAIAICSDIIHFIQISYRGSQETANGIFKINTEQYHLYKCRTPKQAADWFQKYIEELCIQIKDDYESKKNWLLPQIMKYIEVHYMEALSLTAVSDYFNVSSGYISTIFKKHYGVSFIECVTHEKIRHAKQLLLQPETRIHEVASLLGYSDPYYFSKVFKKQTGVSPREYIRKNIEI